MNAWKPVRCRRCRKKYLTEADMKAEAEKHRRGYLNHACPNCGESTRAIPGGEVWHNGQWVKT